MPPDESYIGKTAYRGEIAANYERDRVNEPVWQREQEWFEAWARRIPAGATVLDIPVGTGRFVGILRARGCKLHAVDISEDMLAEVRRRWPEDDGLVIERGDAEVLPYADASFDYIVCWRLFHLLPSATAERVLRELARVNRGTIVLEVFGVEEGGRLALALGACKRRLGRAIRRLARGTAANLSVGSKATMPWAHITNYPHAERQLRAQFARCNLRLLGAETLADYHGRPARIYFLTGGRASL